MTKATVYFTESNKRLNTHKRRSKTIEIPEKMFRCWDWCGIEGIFRVKIKPYVLPDSTVRVNRIKIGRAILQG